MPRETSCTGPEWVLACVTQSFCVQAETSLVRAHLLTTLRVTALVLVAAQPAVHWRHRPRDVAGDRRGEEDRPHREVLRLAVAPDGNLVLRLPRAVLRRVVAADLVAHDAA